MKGATNPLRDASRVFTGLLAAHTRNGPDLESAIVGNRHLAEITLVLGDIRDAASLAEEGIALCGRTADPNRTGRYPFHLRSLPSLPMARTPISIGIPLR